MTTIKYSSLVYFGCRIPLIFLLLLVFSFSGYSQVECKLISKKRSGYFEEYEVLKKRKKVKHGSYIKFKKLDLQLSLHDSNLALEESNEFIFLEQGQYVNGKKEGIWKYYYDYKPWNRLKEEGGYKGDQKHGLWIDYWLDSTYTEYDANQYGNNRKPDSVKVFVNQGHLKTKSVGEYKNGKKTGIWKYYNFEGSLAQNFDHTTKNLKSLSSEDIDLKDHPVQYIGGLQQFNIFMSTMIPEVDFVNQPRSESLIFEVQINPDGTISNIRQLVKNDNISNFDKKIIDALNLSSGHWIAQKKEGLFIPSSFKLNADMIIKRVGESIFYKRILIFEIITEDNSKI